MTQKEMSRTVKKYGPKMVEWLSLGDWHIDFIYEQPQNQNWSASCLLKPEYRLAEITISPELNQTQNDILKGMWHEMLHIVLWPFTTYRDIAEQFALNSPNIEGIEQVAWTQAIETTVNHLERCWPRPDWMPEP